METYTIGANEQERSWFPTFNPNDFDSVASALTRDLKAAFNYDLINPTLWGLIGANGGPVRDFLTSYMQVARTLKEGYRDSAQWPKFKSAFMSVLHIPEKEVNEKIEVYMRYFRQLVLKKEVPDSILYPWTYTPGKSGLASDFLSMFKPLFPYALAGIAVYAGIQVLGKKLLP